MNLNNCQKGDICTTRKGKVGSYIQKITVGSAYPHQIGFDNGGIYCYTDDGFFWGRGRETTEDIIKIDRKTYIKDHSVSEIIQQQGFASGVFRRDDKRGHKYGYITAKPYDLGNIRGLGIEVSKYDCNGCFRWSATLTKDEFLAFCDDIP
jgi:hypothetical protein